MRSSHRGVSQVRELIPHVHQRKPQQIIALPLTRIGRPRVALPHADAPDLVIRACRDQYLACRAQQERQQWRILPEFSMFPQVTISRQLASHTAA